MGVQQNDFVVCPAHLQGLVVVAEAQKVLGESAFFVVAASSLHDCVGAETLTGEACENLACGNVFVSGGAAAVCAFGKYGWCNLAEAVGLNGSGAAGEVHRAVAACPRKSCDCHNMGPFLDRGVKCGGDEAEGEEGGEAANECGGSAGEGEGRAEGEG